jgi:hypothetical protein
MLLSVGLILIGGAIMVFAHIHAAWFVTVALAAMAVAALCVIDRSLRKLALGLAVVASVGTFIASAFVLIPDWVQTTAVLVLIAAFLLDQNATRIHAFVAARRHKPTT